LARGLQSIDIVRILKIAGIMILMSFSAVMAEPAKHVTCTHPKSFGLLEQCQDLKIFEASDLIVKAYALSSKKFLSLKPQSVWKANPILKNDKIEQGTKVLLPGVLLWEASSPFSYTLCEVSSSTQSEIVSLSCGRNEPKKVSRKLAFKIES